jgi:DNA-binding NarL/FixJ family response regulator
MKVPIRVLLVDGHQGVREGLSDRLRRDPRVGALAAVSSLGAALHAGHSFAPDVVLCDPTTIGSDGTIDAPEVVRRLRRLGCPLIVLIPSLSQGERTSLWRAGAAAVLLKGCRFPELLAALEQVATGNASQPQRPSAQPARRRLPRAVVPKITPP